MNAYGGVMLIYTHHPYLILDLFNWKGDRGYCLILKTLVMHKKCLFSPIVLAEYVRIPIKSNLKID